MSASFHPVRARAGISLFFFTNGAMMAGILPRYPEIKAAFELSNTAFGFMVAAGPLASVAASSLPAPLIRRFGAQRVALAWTCAMAAAMVLAGFAPHVGVFALALGLAGFSDAIVDAGQNVHGVRWRTPTARRSSTRCTRCGASARRPAGWSGRGRRRGRSRCRCT